MIAVHFVASLLLLAEVLSVAISTYVVNFIQILTCPDDLSLGLLPKRSVNLLSSSYDLRSFFGNVLTIDLILIISFMGDSCCELYIHHDNIRVGMWFCSYICTNYIARRRAICFL